jgi:hypothetical protein
MRWFVACFVVALAWMWGANASEAAAPVKRQSQNSGFGTSRNAVQAYAVIRVGDEVQVVPKSSVNQKKKDVANKFKSDMKAFNDSSKTKSKSPTHAAGAKKPTKPIFTVIKSSVKTLEEAETARDKYLEEHKELHAQATMGLPGKGLSTRGGAAGGSAKR